METINTETTFEQEENTDKEARIDVTKLPFKVTPLMKISLSVLIVLIILVIMSSLFGQRRSSLGPQPSSLVSVSTGPSSAPRQVSQFAQTEEFSRFEASLTQFQEQTRTIDLKESNLTFPLLEMNVNYNN